MHGHLGCGLPDHLPADVNPSPFILEIQGLKKSFGPRVVLDGINLSIPRGGITCLLGRSGSGKSVLLKSVAMLQPVDAGTILLDQQPLIAGSADLQQLRQRCAFLFQGNALLDSLTALENVALPLEQTTSLNHSVIRQRAMAALEQLELGEFAQRHPGELSGGMQKRLALARALVTQPELILFDEPTAGLDPLRRNAVFEMILEQQQRSEFTALIVTHDIQEALTIADQVAVLDQGRILFAGSPQQFINSTEQILCSFRDSQQSLLAATKQMRQKKPSKVQS